MPMSTFRKNTRSEQKKGGGGKGWRGNWREQFRLPKAAPAPFVLIKGQYTDPDPANAVIDYATGQPMAVTLEYYKWRRHRKKTVNKNTGKQRFIDEPCARGWDKHNPQKCAGCYAEDTGDKSITTGEAFSVGIVHLAVYHRHPVIDYKTGQFVQKKDNSGFAMQDTECQGKTCNFCRVLSGQPLVLQPGETWPNYPQGSITSVFGSRRYLELGSGHLRDLGEWDKQIGSRCGGTAFVRNPDGSYVMSQQNQAIPKGRCNNFLSVDGYKCGNCGNLLINAEQDPRPLDQLEEVASKPYPCHYCNKPVNLIEINSCDAGCSGVIVQGAFDGVLWGQRQGEDTQSHLVLVQFDTLQDFEMNLHPSVKQLLGGKSLSERIEEIGAQYDFAELYKPKDFDKMAERLELNFQQQQPNAYGQPMPGMPMQQNFQQPGVPPPFVPPAGQPAYGQPPMQQPQYPQPGYGQPPQVPQAPQQPAYQSYPQQGPGPAPFQPPAKPNFGA